MAKTKFQRKKQQKGHKPDWRDGLSKHVAKALKGLPPPPTVLERQQKKQKSHQDPSEIKQQWSHDVDGQLEMKESRVQRKRHADDTRGEDEHVLRAFDHGVGKAKNKKEAKKSKRSNAMVPYKQNQSILVVGDGNFSWSAALCGQLGGGAGITATTYDTEDIVKV